MSFGRISTFPILEEILHEVIDTLSTRERKIADSEGREFSLRVRPYRTTDNKIDGAVITLVDIDGSKENRAGTSSRREKESTARK